MSVAYVIQTNKGIRMFDTAESAAAFNGGKYEGPGYETPVAVKKEQHYRGAIKGAYGVLFTNQDQSFGQLLAAINGRRNQPAEE